jgi:hypothetical protein
MRLEGNERRAQRTGCGQAATAEPYSTPYGILAPAKMAHA